MLFGCAIVLNNFCATQRSKVELIWYNMFAVVREVYINKK